MFESECQRLHEIVRAGADRTNRAQVPNGADGIYFYFEQDEVWGHGTEEKRLVRVGSHTAPGNLMTRSWMHRTSNCGASAFVRHAGQALRITAGGPAVHAEACDCKLRFQAWFAAEIGADKICVIRTDWNAVEADCLKAERIAIGILSGCKKCAPSENWLGRRAQNPVIANGQLWLKDHVGTQPNRSEMDWFFGVLAAGML